MTRRLKRTLLPLSLLTMVVSTVLARPEAAFAQVDGLSYTSPTFGYAIAWDTTWFVIDVTSENGSDSITLNNGFSFVNFFGVDSFGGNSVSCVLGYQAYLSREDRISNVSQVPEDQGGTQDLRDQRRAWATFRYTLAFDDGGTVDLIDHFECRTIVPGQSVVQVTASMRADEFAFQKPAVDGLIASLQLPSLGESGPVFASGPWRIAIVAAERDVTIPEVRLKENEGKEWVAVVADVTNWSREDAVFDWSAVSLEAGGDAVALADKATLSVARTLDAEPGDLEQGRSIAPGETVRATFVFRIGDDRRGPALRVGDESLSLLSPLSVRGVDLRELPAPVTPPALIEASVDRVIDGASMEVVLPDGEERTIRLAGVDAPVDDDCFSADSMRRLRRLAGATVLLESTAPGDNETYHVWVDGDDGVRTLLNQAMIAGGHAGQTGGNTGRFGSWLVASEERARDDGRGLWSRCTDLHGEPIEGSDEGDEASGPGRNPSADATAEATATAEADTSYDGTWSGETAEGADISFTIKNGGVTRFRVAYECPGTSGTMTTTYTKPVPVVDDGFTLDLARPASNTDDFLTATIGSDGDASGEIRIAAEGCPGDVIATTWRATRDAA